jgi:hypothetical protein
LDNIFDEVWSDICEKLLPGTLIRNWNVEEGYYGGAFRINHVDDGGVIIPFGQMAREKRVSKRDFQRVFARWEAYNRGTISRAELGKWSENATYILSILQWREAAQSSAASIPRSAPAPSPPQQETAPTTATVVAGNTEYAKTVLHETTEGRAVLYGPSVEINYGAGAPARIDATVGDIAVDIEAGVSRQVRGAVLDLICHPYPKKLLVLLPDHHISRGVTGEQCRNILKRFCPDGSFRVLVLKGSASGPQLVEDTAIMAAVLADLRTASD